MTTTISAMNGSLAQFKLETSRMVIEPLISECLSALEVEYGKNPLHDYIENNFDGVMEIFQYLKSLNVGNNERLILSRSKLASYLLSNALHATKGTDKGTLANHMTRHAKDLIFDKVKDIPLEVNKNTLAYLCTEAVLEQNNLQTERVEENNLLKLIDETAQLLYSKKHDFTGYETASRILEYYHSVVKQGFLPTYVEQYLTDIGATDEQKTPEVKQAMINYLMKSGLQSKQYAAGKDPWEADIEKFDKENSAKLETFKTTITTGLNKTVETSTKHLNEELSRISTSVTNLDMAIPDKVKAHTTSLVEKLDAAINNIKDLEKQIKVLQSKENNDLTIIEGIGDALQKVLNDNGIKSFRKLIDLSANELSAILKRHSMSQHVESSKSWQKQAQLALDDKLEELKAFQDVLKGGVMPKTP